MIEIKNISKSFNGKLILKDINFQIDKSSFVSIFGPNAAGKTTLLNLISGLLVPDTGEILWDGGKQKIKVAYVFQDYRDTLFPWRKVIDNIALPLKLKGWSKEDRHKSVNDLIDRFNIELDTQKYPYELSGGQQQLVAILRGIITSPDLLLLDEPFSAIDFQRKIYLHSKILEIWQKTKTTIVFISHDLEEAIYLADKVILIGGRPTTVLKESASEISRPRYTEQTTTQEFIDMKKGLLDSLLQNLKIEN